MFKKFILTALIGLLAGGSWWGYVSYQDYKAKRFKSYVESVVELAKVDLSATGKQNLVDKIIKYSNQYINSYSAREIFVLILFIETKFNHKLKSPVGAVGVSQLMPPFFLEFAKICNLKVKQEDIYDLDINLTVGACLFNDLMVKQEGNYLLAAAAYNSGNNSPTVKKLKQLGSINPETANYVAKLALLRKVVGNP